MREGDATALDALLLRRSQALAAGNAKAYAATAIGPQRLRDREAARNAAPVRLRDVELAVESTDVRGRRAKLAVRSIYGIRGVRGTFASARRVTAVRTGKGWRISSESSRRERHPWEVGPVAEHRSTHFVVIAPRALDISRADRRARDRLRAHGGRPETAAAAQALPRGRGGRGARRPRADRAHQRRRGPGGAVGLRGPRVRADAARDRGGLAAAGRGVAAVQHARRRRAHARRDP